MIDWLIVIILSEIILFLGIKIVYWADYTNSYIHCHCNTEPCKDNIFEFDDEFLYNELEYWKNNYNSLYESVKDHADDKIIDSRGNTVGVIFDD